MASSPVLTLKDRMLPVTRTPENSQYLGDPNFYGQTVKPEQSLFEKVARYFYNSNDPLGYGPGTLEAPAGIVINPKNASLINKTVDTLKKSILKGWDIPARNRAAYENLAEALAYAQTKHPRLTGLVDRFNPSLNPINSEYNIVGKYMPEINEALISTKSVNGPQSIQDLVNTILHESRHALSNKRTPTIFNEAFGDLGFNPLGIGSLEESRAYQAGDTAGSTYQKYKNMLNSLWQNK